MIRKIVAAAALAVASLMIAVPAHALSQGDTVCYAADGSAVVNPLEPGRLRVLRDPASSDRSTGGGSTPVLCTADVYFYGYDDGLGSTSPYRTRSCTPPKPLQG